MENPTYRKGNKKLFFSIHYLTSIDIYSFFSNIDRPYKPKKNGHSKLKN